MSTPTATAAHEPQRIILEEEALVQGGLNFHDVTEAVAGHVGLQDTVVGAVVERVLHLHDRPRGHDAGELRAAEAAGAGNTRDQHGKRGEVVDEGSHGRAEGAGWMQAMWSK